MLCEKCQKNEAHIKVTRVINGVSDTRNLCEQCAAEGFPNIRPENISEWSKAIFKLISDSAAGIGHENQRTEQEKLKRIACPNCGKTYGSFLEDGIFGCGDCYEVFAPFFGTLVKGLQGTESHVGKKVPKHVRAAEPKQERPVDPEQQPAEEALETPVSSDLHKKTDNSTSQKERISELNAKLSEAVLIEDYMTAAKIRDEIRALEGGSND